MKNYIKLLAIFSCAILHYKNSTLKAQIIRNYCLEVSVTTRDYTPGNSILDFKWPYRTPDPDLQFVYRKLKGNYTWDTVFKYFAVTDSTFSDTVPTGSDFEYQFYKDTGMDGSTLYGFINAGHRVPVVLSRGKILMITDSTHKTFLDTSLRTFRNDLTGDGWMTQVQWFSPTTSVPEIKAYIDSVYALDPVNVKSVVLIGNLAVPYSGDFISTGDFPPDGHTTGNPPSHEGAWPADCYYGDIDTSSWTDVSVNNTLGARTANNNIPGDGKFDQTTLPNLITLQVGRIDLSGMTSFSKNERELLKQYFTKNHNFRHKLVNIQERCLIDDNFGLVNYPYPFFDETFGNNAYRNMAALINDTCTKALDYLSTMDTIDYLWSFGMGNGGYTSCTGVGNTAAFASQSVKSVFSGLFGSYFGDWDNDNNLLRAPLASDGNVLNTFWAGRPHWYFHHMGLGETIGYSALRTQNNFDTVTADYLYPTVQASPFQIHVALMGDPSVRMQPVEPVSLLTAVQDSCSSRFILNWEAPSDTAVHDYYVFRANNIDSVFTLLMITPDTNFIDSTPLAGNNVYMVRSQKLQFSGSGTYYNLGQGIFDEISFSAPVANAGNDTAVCTNSYVRIGAVNDNPNTTYTWSPASFPRDTTTVQATSSGNRVLLATDTLSGCVQTDTMVLTAIALPASETLSGIPFNLCGDSAIWSSTQNNGPGFNYAWTFDHGTPDTSGLGLYDPGLIRYDDTGTFMTTLMVTDTLTQCFNSDVIFYTVNCYVALPVPDFIFNCDKTGKGMTKVLFTSRSNHYFSSFVIEGLSRESQWVALQTIDGESTASNEFIFGTDQYSNIRLSGVKYNNSKISLAFCGNSSRDQVNLIYPVPVENELNINFNYFTYSTISYSIYNSLGQQIDLPVLRENAEFIKLDTGNLPVGNYVLLIMVDNELKQVKFNKI